MNVSSNVVTPLVRRVLAFTDAPAAPTATAHRPEAYASNQIASEYLARLAESHPSYRHDVQRHAA